MSSFNLWDAKMVIGETKIIAARQQTCLLLSTRYCNCCGRRVKANVPTISCGTRYFLGATVID